MLRLSDMGHFFFFSDRPLLFDRSTRAIAAGTAAPAVRTSFTTGVGAVTRAAIAASTAAVALTSTATTTAAFRTNLLDRVLVHVFADLALIRHANPPFSLYLERYGVCHILIHCGQLISLLPSRVYAICLQNVHTCTIKLLYML